LNWTWALPPAGNQTLGDPSSLSPELVGRFFDQNGILKTAVLLIGPARSHGFHQSTEQNHAH
jgi:hypothetical protein